VAHAGLSLQSLFTKNNIKSREKDLLNFLNNTLLIAQDLMEIKDVMEDGISMLGTTLKVESQIFLLILTQEIMEFVLVKQLEDIK